MPNIRTNLNGLIIFISILVLLGAGSVFAEVEVLVADEPDQCLLLEGLFIDGENYILIDGRNNTGRMKLISPDGTVLRTGVSTVPLPDAASMPGDVLPSPFGLDRVVPAGDSLWVLPATWSGLSAESFNYNTGEFQEQIPGFGVAPSGLAVGPDGNIWAVLHHQLVNINSHDLNTIDLYSAMAHIDTATGHPMGFIVLSQPEIALVEPSGMIRWRLPLDQVTDNFLSPMDIACGPDGTIAVCAAVCEMDEIVTAEYFDLRTQALQAGEYGVVDGLEDALRSNFAVGFVILIIQADGTVAEIVDLGAVPEACAVDFAGRVHVITQELDSWAISMIDPGINEGILQCTIPYGTPTLISPHRLASGPDGSLYWDDLLPDGMSWGIGRLSASSGPFSLGTGESSISRAFTEPLADALRVGTALECGADGDFWVGYQDFPWTIAEEDLDSFGSAYSSSYLHIDRDGVLLRRDPSPDLLGAGAVLCDLLYRSGSPIGAWAGSSIALPLGKINTDGTWEPNIDFTTGSIVANARIGEISNGHIGWFAVFEGDLDRTRWFRFSSELAGSVELDRLGVLKCRYLASDPSSDNLYVTIDDGEIFRLDATDLQVTGIWHNRLFSGAPGHVLHDAEWHDGKLAVLDREHRAIIAVSPEDFIEPVYASEPDVSDAINTITAAFDEYYYQNSIYPPTSPGNLEDLLELTDLNLIRQSFIGGRIYHYRITDMGYEFTVWSGASNQPAVITTVSGTETIY